MVKKYEQTGTEGINPDFREIDQWPVDKAMNALLDEQIKSLNAVRPAIPLLARAAEDAARRLESSPNGRIIYAGAGTSIRIGVQDGTELTPTFGWAQSRMAAVIAGGVKALNMAIEDAEDNPRSAAKRIAQLKLTPCDVCIAIAASGITPFTVAACRAAKDAGALVIGIASNSDTALMQLADYPVFLDTGAEPIAGSTRMNAGTAQKSAINMLSTMIMMRLGRVHDGLMVNLVPTNAKLRERAKAIVSRIAGCDPDDAGKYLERARIACHGVTDNNIKLAILLAKGIDEEAALRQLAQQKGHLRPILSGLK